MSYLGLLEANTEVLDFVKGLNSQSAICWRQYFDLIHLEGCMAGVRFLGAGVGRKFDGGIPHLNDYCAQATRT